MIVTCDGCQTKYLLGDDKVPENGIRVRCPKCRFVWRLTPPVRREPLFEVSSGAFASGQPVEDEAPMGGWASMEHVEKSVLTETEQQAEEIEIPVQSSEPEERRTESPEMRKKKDRARRLARVFVSDILVYNQEKRDRGLADGDLMTVLGPEIKKAWEAYKEKIGSEVAESNEYFRTALNEILADGKEIF
ncbi:MAG TPA: hypothetical protein ENO08_04125 [Candidatus Eisenbacteria bacterium]|uniref:Zinc finger/thioredoxin putative domain-containing protein n=1 Tax=Eiseniibacteriota bacterium TaxID=2212470 RepID=A0A7V2AUQ1_UNCEI|nr:hypothetical protein [Candidatus Eisenbacteria bacterium]